MKDRLKIWHLQWLVLFKMVAHTSIITWLATTFCALTCNMRFDGNQKVNSWFYSLLVLIFPANGSTMVEPTLSALLAAPSLQPVMIMMPQLMNMVSL